MINFPGYKNASLPIEGHTEEQEVLLVGDNKDINEIIVIFEIDWDDDKHHFFLDEQIYVSPWKKIADFAILGDGV